MRAFVRAISPCGRVLRKGLILLFLSISWALPAQETDSLPAARVLSVREYPVVRPSEQTLLQERADAPVQVADIVRRFTGVQVKDYGGLGGLKTINVRSLGSEHVGIFLDGILIEDSQNMQVDLGRFSVDGLSAVSLFMIQKSDRLQTAREYASGASVHLESGVPEADGGVVRLRGGSFGTVSPSVQWDRIIGPVTLRLGGEYLRTRGAFKFPYNGVMLQRENADLQSGRLEALLSGRTRGGDWRLRAYGYASERGLPGPVVRRAEGFPFSAERQADRNVFLQGRWRQDWSERYATALWLKASGSYLHYATHPEKNPMALPYDNHYRQRALYGSLAQSLILSAPWSADLSADVQYNALDSDAGQSVTPRRLTFTGALATRFVRPRFRLSTHLLWQGAWDWYNTPSAGGWSRENGFRDAWMPSLTVFFAPFPWLEVEGFLKRSYRLPSFNDLYYVLMGNARLRPESATQAGMELFLHGGFRHWNFELRLSPYYNRVTDKIVAISTASQFRWTMLNLGRVDILGADARACAAYRSGDWSASLTLRYTFQRALDHSTPGASTYGAQIPYVPRHSGSADASLSWKTWSFTWNTLVTGERWSRSANIPDYHIPSWTLSDLSLSKTWLLSRDPSLFKTGLPSDPSLQVALSVNNLFNLPYEVVQGYPMPGTHALLSLTFRW